MLQKKMWSGKSKHLIKIILKYLFLLLYYSFLCSDIKGNPNKK